MNPFVLGPDPAPFRGRSPAFAAAAVVLGLAAAYSACLWPEWSHNPDLSHGFLAPLIFLLLVTESRRLGPARWLQPARWTAWAQGAALTGALVLFTLAGLFAASLGWSHALVLFLLAGALAIFSLGSWLTLADIRIRLVPFNWIAFTAILLWVLVAPLPTGTYYRLTLTLQSWVTSGVMHTLQFFGIPARQHGNVIELAHATVGVAEACSGIRSLLACVYAGFFFAAWQVRRPARRVVLLVLAPLLALGMNFLRSLLLTLLADHGVNINGPWHDVTGYAILAITAVVLAVVAFRLETPAGVAAPAAAFAPPAPRWAGATVLIFGVVLLGGAGFFAAKSHTAPEAGPPPAPLAELLPASYPGWEVRTADNLYQFSGVLQTDQLIQRTYLRAGGPNGFTNLTIYIAYWPAGQASVSRVAQHTPDACWPGAGWIPLPRDANTLAALTAGGRDLARPEYRTFRTENGLTQNVWFWHVFAGRVLPFEDPYSLPALLKLSWQYGFRRPGAQYFVRISSTQSWEEIRDEPLVKDLVTQLARLGI